MNISTLRAMLIRGVCAMTAAAAMGSSQAQDYNAMIQQQMKAMNDNIARGQQQVNNIVQQRMQDPQVQASYQQYVAQMQRSGQQPMDYPSYTYQYVYTNGFSAQGVAAARANEANNSARERAAVQGVRDAERNRAAAMAQQQQSYSANQQEAGRQLMGNSTYTAPNGSQTVLPHTWQNNSSHRYQGNNYHVDTSGQYWVQGSDGYWYALRR